MKSQALFSLKDTSKKLKCRLLQFLFGALSTRVNSLSTTDENIWAPVVQSIVSLTSSLRGQLVKCFTTL